MAYESYHAMMIFMHINFKYHLYSTKAALRIPKFEMKEKNQPGV